MLWMIIMNPSFEWRIGPTPLGRFLIDESVGYKSMLRAAFRKSEALLESARCLTAPRDTIQRSVAQLSALLVGSPSESGCR
jgi:hypothetical protein